MLTEANKMRIGICGTQSTGKSTLVKALMEDNAMFNSDLAEYKFFTERSKQLQSEGAPLNKKSTFNGQIIFAAERAKELMNKNMITDRTSIDVAAFTEAAPNISVHEKTGLTFTLLELTKQYDLIIYIPPVIPLINNGVRDIDEEYRKQIDELIQKLLKHPNVVDKLYCLKSVDLMDRIKEVKAVMKFGEANKQCSL